MKTIGLLFFLIMVGPYAFSQTPLNIPLQTKLHEMFKEDQKWRKEAIKLQKNQHSDYDEETINKNMEQTDSLNLISAKQIVQQYGYPGYSLVGENGSSWFWAIVQHCDDDPAFQQKVLTLMGKEVKHNNASGEDYALLTDRVLANQGKKQLYGTQIRFNPKTKTYTPLPMEDSIHVDKRRKAVGLQPLDKYMKQF